MPEETSLASQVSIKVDGNEVQSDTMGKLAAVMVDQHAFLPAMFTIRFYDADLSITDSGPFNLTKPVEIAAKDADNNSIILIKGEITALEPEFGENMIPEFVVRGYDQTHRLFRETRSRAFVNVKDSDLAQQIAGGLGLQMQVDATQTVYDHVWQSNQTDLGFLMQRAWRIGYECYIDDQKLYFRKPPNDEQAAITLGWGQDLKKFTPRMTLSEQVDEVVVRGWDAKEKREIVGRADTGSLYPAIEEDKNGQAWAHDFGTGKKIVVDQPVVSQAEADVLAAARLDEISGAFVDAEGMATRRPDIRAGKKVKLENLGNRFSGEYLVTSAVHHYTPEGLTTHFRVSGSRLGLLSEMGSPESVKPVWNGVVIGQVTNTDDPEDRGRVKLKYPWLTADVESDWAKVLGMGAGPNCGFYVIPAVNDEVLVAFEHGDIHRPYVLGGLWSQNAAIPGSASASAGDEAKVRVMQSIDGHIIAMYDNDQKKIEILTKDGRKITLSDADRKIIIENSNVTLTLEESNLKVEAVSNLTLEAQQIKLSASSGIEIDGGAKVDIKGGQINLN